MTQSWGTLKYLIDGYNKMDGLRQTRIVGEAEDVSIITIKAWMEQKYSVG